MPDWNGYFKGGANTALNLASGNIAGAAISGIGATMSLFGGKSNSAKAAQQQFEHNLALQKQSQEWNEYMYKNRYQMQRGDLEKAGINPLFGMGQAPSVTSGTNSVGMADYVGEQNNKFQQAMSLLDFGQNLSAKRAQTRLLENQANTESINTNLKTMEVQTQQLENLRRKKDLTYQEKLLKSQLELNISQTNNNIMETQKKQAEIRGIDANTGRIILENQPLLRRENFIKKLKQNTNLSVNQIDLLAQEMFENEKELFADKTGSSIKQKATRKLSRTYWYK